MPVTRMTRMVGFSIPPAMAEELERMADEEQRTKSELFREMFRVYRNYRRQKQRDEEGADRFASHAKEEAQASPRTDAEAARATRQTAPHAHRQAKALDIRDEEANNPIMKADPKERGQGKP